MRNNVPRCSSAFPFPSGISRTWHKVKSLPHWEARISCCSSMTEERVRSLSLALCWRFLRSQWLPVWVGAGGTSGSNRRARSTFQLFLSAPHTHTCTQTSHVWRRWRLSENRFKHCVLTSLSHCDAVVLIMGTASSSFHVSKQDTQTHEQPLRAHL